MLICVTNIDQRQSIITIRHVFLYSLNPNMRKNVHQSELKMFKNTLQISLILTFNQLWFLETRIKDTLENFQEHVVHSLVFFFF